MSRAWITRSPRKWIRNCPRVPAPGAEASLLAAGAVRRAGPRPPRREGPPGAAAAVARGCAAGTCAPLAVEDRRRLPSGTCVPGGAGSGVAAARPRSGTPWRWTMRYREDSPIPNRSRISAVGRGPSAYSRATSRCCSGLSRRRVERSGLSPPGCACWAVCAERSSAGNAVSSAASGRDSIVLKGSSFDSYNLISSEYALQHNQWRCRPDQSSTHGCPVHSDRVHHRCRG